MVKNQCLEIKIGDEYLSKVESIENFEQSFFSEVYFKAFKSVEEIVKNNTEKKEALEYEDYSEEKEEEFIDYENYNNIIAFTGERGTGKTSAMLSVSKALKFKDSKENKIRDFMGNEDRFNLDEYKFLGLKVIDPSHFQENRNIIEIILAKMFEKFKKSVENCNNENNGDKREVIKCFEEVYKNLKSISKKDVIGDEEAIDTLLKMSASSDLKGNLEKLTEAYLDFMDKNKKENKKCGKRKEKNKVLLLEIDDLDLNTKYAYEMIEQIRKYLIIKNIVILMAVKIEQLSLVIEKNTREEFKDLIKAGQISDEKINIMSDKYLKKLIPLERRLYMPNLEIESESKKIKIKKKDKEGKLKESEEEIIDKKVRSLIYHKTGMEFIDGKYIVPNNLRDLINIISFLEKMPDLKEEEKEKKTITNNFLLWKEYIFEIWVKKYLSIKQQQILKELYERDVEEKNKYIINKVEGLYDLLEKDDKFKDRRKFDEKEEYTELEKEYQDIINLNNNPKNICLGDVLFVLDKAKKYKVELQEQRFIYAIKMVYSIMLSEIYEASEKDLSDDYENINDYQKLLGGYLYHPSIKKIMRESNSGAQEEDSKRISRDRVVISVEKIKALNISFNKIIEKLNEVNDNEKLKKDKIFKIFKIFRVKKDKIYSQGKKIKETRLKDLSYEYISIEKSEKIEFDILGFLYNIKKGDFYIRNIEILETIFSRNYQGSTSIDFLDHLNIFIKNYKKEIELGFSGGTINLFKEKDTITFIEKVVNILDENENLKKEFNKLMSLEKKVDLKSIKESLLNLKTGDEFVQKQALKRFIKVIKEEIGKQLKDNLSKKKSKEILDKLEEIKDGSFINYYDKNGALSGEGEKVYGKKSEIIENYIKVLEDYFKTEGIEE